MTVGGRAVLDLPPVLFTKLDLYCGRFTILHNSKILIHEISSQRGAQSSILFSKRFLDLMLT